MVIIQNTNKFVGVQNSSFEKMLLPVPVSFFTRNTDMASLRRLWCRENAKVILESPGQKSKFTREPSHQRVRFC